MANMPSLPSNCSYCCPSRKIGFIIGITILLVIGLGVKKYLYENAAGYYYEETQLSQALQKIVDYGTTLHLLELKTQKLLHEDPYENLVESKLKPAHEKMQSIKKQTKIYEDMQRIPGGPQNFMTTALTTVEEIRRKINGFEEEYYKITTKISQEITALDQDTQKCWNQAKSLMSENDLRITLLKGIFLDNPARSTRGGDEATTKAEPFPKPNTKSFEEILDSLSSLADLAAKFEKVKAEFENLIIKFNITEPEEIYETPAFPLAQQLSDLDNELDNKIRDENYEAFIPYVKLYLKKLDDNLHSAQEHLAKKRMRYESLVEMLETDQKNLKERIKKLRFSKQNDEF